MGTWGTGLYQDDTACDVKESIKDRLIYGDEEGKRYTKEELIESILEEYEDYMQLDDDRAIVILVLADILWKNGMLTDNLKMEALKIIENKTDLERWGEDKELYKKREKVLEALKIKIESNQPEEKIIKIKRRPKPYICPWKVGDRFAYELKSEKAKEYGLEGRFLIISFERAMEWGDRDNKYYIPVMHIQITEDNKIPSTYEEIEKCEYIIDEYNPKKEKYRYSTIISDNITSRVQKLYKYIGNFPVTGLLEDEYIDNGIPLWLTWYNFGDNKIENYIKLGTNKNKKINIEEYKKNLQEWGTRFYDNQITFDTNKEYCSLLHVTESNEEALQKIMEYKKNIIEDKDKDFLFWVALADAQWEYGRLVDDVKNKAIEYIEKDERLKKWEIEVEEIKEKLNKKQPKERDVYKRVCLKANWKVGDFLLCQIKNEELKEHKWYEKYILLQVISMQISKIDFLPTNKYCDEEEIVVLYNWIGDKQIDLNKISELELVFFKDEERSYGKELKLIGLYHLTKEELNKVNIKVIKNDINNLNADKITRKYPYMYRYNIYNFDSVVIEALEREEKRGNLVKDFEE